MPRREVTVTDLSAVVYSSGRVFDGLQTNRLNTEEFLRSGDTEGITSKHDLALLEDLRDAAQVVVDRMRVIPKGRIDADFVEMVNAAMTRSASIHPGEFRPSGSDIGVDTRYGRHLPPALDHDGLQRLLATSLSGLWLRDQAIELFISLAKAQPFWDGNKRTALLVANALLLSYDYDRLLSVPVEEGDPRVQGLFNDYLALAYIHDDREPLRQLLLEYGFAPIGEPNVIRQPPDMSVFDEILWQMTNLLDAASRAQGLDSADRRQLRGMAGELSENLRRSDLPQESREAMEQIIAFARSWGEPTNGDGASPQ